MTGELPSWNFGKYVVSRDGRTVRYFDPATTPEDPGLLAAIDSALAE
jgi:glutathione peroxidase